MPRKYEHIRDAIYQAELKKGAAAGPAYDRAQSIAAATFNKHRKPGTKPVTGKD